MTTPTETYRVVPCFLQEWTRTEFSEARALLAAVLGDPDCRIRWYRRAAGVDVLRDLASTHPGCADLAAAADLLDDSDHAGLALGLTTKGMAS